MCHGVVDRLDELIDRTIASLEISRGEEQHVAGIGSGDDDRCLPARCRSNRVGLVVAMKGVERHRQPGLACLPLRSLADRSVSDFAQGTMPSTETGTDPIGEFAAHRAVGVIHADEAHDPLAGCRVGGAHHDSIADWVPSTAAVGRWPVCSAGDRPQHEADGQVLHRERAQLTKLAMSAIVLPEPVFFAVPGTSGPRGAHRGTR